MSPEERDRSILDGAVELALDGGLDGLTVRAVAARVGVTPALVAHYRPVMDDFLAEVFGVIVAAERAEVLAAFDPTAGIRTDLSHLVDTLLDGQRDDITLVWVQGWALGSRNEALAARVRTEMDLWQTAIEERLAQAVTSGELAPTRTDTAAWLLLALIDGMNAHSLVKWAPHDRAALAHRVLAVVLDPSDPDPSDPASSDPAPSDPASSDPSDPAPADPASTDPAPRK